MKDEKSSNLRTVWHLAVPPHLNQQLEDYIMKDAFKTKSEFIRAAVRDRLKIECDRMQMNLQR